MEIFRQNTFKWHLDSVLKYIWVNPIEHVGKTKKGYAAIKVQITIGRERFKAAHISSSRS